MDIAESLATTEDFVASDVETELSVNGSVFPEPKEGSFITAGWPSLPVCLFLCHTSSLSSGQLIVGLTVHVFDCPPDSLTQGSRVLLPHVSTLLQYLSRVVRNTGRLKQKKFKAHVAKELNILSK